MPLRLRLLLALALTALLIAPACKRKSGDAGQVVLYVSADEHIARDVIDRFQTQTGISVQVVGDTEAKKTTGLVERLRAERNNPQADVLWSSEIGQTILLADEGVFEEHLSDATNNWPREWRDGQRRWFAFAARPRVIVFSPERMSEDQRPDTWMSLTNARWRDKVVMADPRFGTTGTHLGAMLALWDRQMPGFFRAWSEGLAENNVRLLPSGNAGVVEAVASGEADVGMTDADDVWAAKKRGLKVELIYPSHAPPANAPAGDDADTTAASGTETGTGTLLIPNTVARVKGGPNAANAKLLIDFLLSEEIERLLAESDSHNVPMRENVRGSFPQYAVPDPLKVDWSKAATLRGKAIDQFFEAMESVKSGRADAAEIEQSAASQPSATQADDAADVGADGGSDDDGGAGEHERR